MWSKARLTTYIGTALVGLAVLASIMGVATYDPATGMIDLHPFSVYALAAIIAGPLASGLAAVALFLGWGAK
jgi:hypothetical protein